MVDRSVAPPFSVPEKFILPKPEIIRLSNGSNFYLLEGGDQPVIKLEFIFNAGIRFEKNPGEAFFGSKMLLEGTKKYSSKDISTTLERFGAFSEVQPGFDYSNFSIHIPTENFHKIIDILKEILFQTNFPENELELMKQIQIQQLCVNQQKNSFAASRLFRSRLFNGNPYGHLMSEEAIKKIEQESLVHFYQKWMHGKFDIFITGKFDHHLTKSILNFIEDNLQSAHDFNLIANADASEFHEYEERKGSLQTAIYLGNKSINRSDPKYPALLLLNEVFGGYFGSRLMQNIREEKGYTYSIYSHLASLRDDAYFVINTDVKKEFKDQTIDEISKEIERIKSEPIEKDELFQAKNYLKGSILNTLTNSFAISEKLKNVYLYNLGENFYDHLFDEIDRVQADELLQLANSHLFDRPLSSAMVG